MNKENVEIAINVMKRVKSRGGNLKMVAWQKSIEVLHTEDALINKCGTACCFAGWLGVSPEFKEKGGFVYAKNATPSYEGSFGSGAIANFLDVNLHTACLLTFTSGNGSFSFYGVESVNDVTFDMVIEKLELILKGELV